jgi:hypothetical protein
MTDKEIEVVRAVIGVLREPRDKFGAIRHSDGSSDVLHDVVDVFGKLPHGGYDSADKAQMILSTMVGDKPESILDLHRL